MTNGDKQLFIYLFAIDLCIFFGETSVRMFRSIFKLDCFFIMEFRVYIMEYILGSALAEMCIC